MKKLQEFAKFSTSKNYEELLKEVVKKVCCVKLEGNSANNSRNSSTTSVNIPLAEGQSAKSVLERFQEKASECKVNYESGQQPNWDELQIIAKELLEKVKEEESSNKLKKEGWKLLTPWYDTVIIAELILEKELDKDIRDIVTAIKKGRVKYFDGRHVFDQNIVKRRLHAEMGIIEGLFNKKNKNTQYIGLTKLSCDDCYAVISILNEKGHSREVCNRHGKEYPDWLTPTFIKGWENEIRIKKGEYKEKGWILETTSELPTQSTQLSSPVELLRKLQEKEQRYEAFQEVLPFSDEY